MPYSHLAYLLSPSPSADPSPSLSADPPSFSALIPKKFETFFAVKSLVKYLECQILLYKINKNNYDQENVQKVSVSNEYDYYCFYYYYYYT